MTITDERTKLAIRLGDLSGLMIQKGRRVPEAVRNAILAGTLDFNQMPIEEMRRILQDVETEVLIAFPQR